MPNIHHEAYGRTCPACIDGRLWLTPPPDRDEIRLCDEHEPIISNAPGWVPADA